MKKILIGLTSVLLVGGCGNVGSVECGGEASTEAVGNLIRSGAEEAVQEVLESGSQLDAFDRSKLASALSKAKIDLSMVRTTRDDPDSSRQFCAAEVKVVFPQSILQAVDEARRNADIESRKQIANRAGLKQTASGFSDTVEYSIQPTDDGGEVIAESDGASALISVLGDMFASYLLSDEIRAANIEQSRAAAEEQARMRAEEAAAQQLEEEQVAASEEYQQAVFEEAKVENKLESQRIAAVWQALPAETREQIAPMQTAWNKKTTARCKVEAAGTSTVVAEVRAAQMRCETEAMRSRVRELSQYTG